MRVRVDLGRVFPGLVLVLTALGLYAVLIIVAVVSFMFSFDRAAEGVLWASLKLLLVPTLVLAAGVLTVLAGVSWWGGGEGWFSGVAKARALKDRIGASERAGEVIGTSISVLILLFLYANQTRGVAFFTSSFGLAEMFFFYAPLVVGIALSLSRAVYGRRNAIRPFDSLQGLFMALAAFWLLAVFPFDFTHFADMFPSSIQFLFAWLTDDVGRLVLTVAGVVALAVSGYTMALYAAVRGQLLRLPAPSF